MRIESEIKHCDVICNVCAMVWKSYWIYLLVSQFYGSRKSSEIGGSSYRCDICSNLFLQSTEYMYFRVLKWFAWLHVHVIISRYSLPWIKIIHVLVMSLHPYNLIIQIADLHAISFSFSEEMNIYKKKNLKKKFCFCRKNILYHIPCQQASTFYWAIFKFLTCFSYISPISL